MTGARLERIGNLVMLRYRSCIGHKSATAQANDRHATLEALFLNLTGERYTALEWL